MSDLYESKGSTLGNSKVKIRLKEQVALWRIVKRTFYWEKKQRSIRGFELVNEMVKSVI